MLKPIVRAHPAKLVVAGLVVGGIIVAACEIPTPPEQPAGKLEAASQSSLAETERQAVVKARLQKARPLMLRSDTLRLVPTMRSMASDDDPEPIIYVDDQRVTTLKGLAPDRIERVEVLKGAAAQRILGADHAGGVIKIFTKTDSN